MFVGAYAVEYTKQRAKGQWNIKTAVERGCRAAVVELDHPGCIYPVPWADEVDWSESETARN